MSLVVRFCEFAGCIVVNYSVVLKELIESGKVTPVIDRTYPLSETPEAFEYLDEGHARGKVVITV